jgi:hypothetical protein
MKVEFDTGKRIVTVNGVSITLEVLEAMTSPRRKLGCFARIGNRFEVIQLTDEEIKRHVDESRHV